MFAFRPDPQADAQRANEDWLASLGANPTERANAIEAMFVQGTKTIRATQFDKWSAQTPDPKAPQPYIRFTVSRSLATMEPRERELLRGVEHLNNLMNGQLELYRRWRAALLWGEGKGQTVGAVESEGLNREDPIGEYTARLGLRGLPQVINAVFTHLREVRDDPQARADLRQCFGMMFEKLNGNLAGSGAQAAGGANPSLLPIAPKAPQAPAPTPPVAPRSPAGPAPRTRETGSMLDHAERPGFLAAAAMPQTCFRTQGPYPIHLGTFQDGTWLSYSGSGALVTIAPPGSGKSQCHVIPNLLQWQAPAVVLDVKGELYAATSKWRAANVGPVFRFAPTDSRRSHHYNPLAFVSDEPDQIWQESRFLADMLIVPSGNKENRFWDESSKSLVSAAIAHIVYSSPPNERSMSSLLDIIHGGAPFKQMIDGLRLARDVPPMMRRGTSLAEMDEKTKANILSTVETSFQAWEDAPVVAVTDRCDWSPLDLRNGSPGRYPTVYVCLKPREVEAYISVLRVFIAQHIRMLTAELPAEGARAQILPILFLLDELPRLKEMPPVAEAIEIGASYGLRVWMFAQSLGQLQQAYPNADGMISSCAVRIYFNPTGADGLAEKLSKELGNVASLADGTQQPLVPANELAGPKWNDWQLVLALSTRPARVRKNFAYQIEELQARTGAA